MIEIPLTLGYVAIIDDCDAIQSTYKWHAAVRETTVYAARHYAGKYLLLHRVLLGITDPKIQADHEDRNGLNCRRNNLRLANHQQNQCNKNKQANHTSKFVGVYWNKVNKKWIAQIQTKGKIKYIGSFTNETEAAQAYDEVARELHGCFAKMNFPQEIAA